MEDNSNPEDLNNQQSSKSSISAPSISSLICSLRDKVKILKKLSDEQPKQRTGPWYEKRKFKITASSGASCLPKNWLICDDYIKTYNLDGKFRKNDLEQCNPYSSKVEFILQKKGYTSFTGNEATQWGNKYEDAALRFYEHWYNTKVIAFNILDHPTIDFLACSPDGITTEGTMLEIKCPPKRKLTGIPPFYYWIQCQLQLEVCDLEECDFIECKLNAITKDEWEHGSSTVKLIKSPEVSEDLELSYSKGLLININNVKFLYPPHKYNHFPQRALKWALKKEKKYKLLNARIEYYKIYEIAINPIRRNKTWFANALPYLQDTFDKLQNFTEDDAKEYLQIVENKKKQQTGFDYKDNIAELNVCLFSDSDDEKEKIKETRKTKKRKILEP